MTEAELIRIHEHPDCALDTILHTTDDVVNSVTINKNSPGYPYHIYPVGNILDATNISVETPKNGDKYSTEIFVCVDNGPVEVKWPSDWELVDFDCSMVYEDPWEKRHNCGGGKLLVTRVPGANVVKYNEAYNGGCCYCSNIIVTKEKSSNTVKISLSPGFNYVCPSRKDRIELYNERHKYSK